MKARTSRLTAEMEASPEGRRILRIITFAKCPVIYEWNGTTYRNETNSNRHREPIDLRGQITDAVVNPNGSMQRPVKGLYKAYKQAHDQMHNYPLGAAEYHHTGPLFDTIDTPYGEASLPELEPVKAWCDGEDKYVFRTEAGGTPLLVTTTCGAVREYLKGPRIVNTVLAALRLFQKHHERLPLLIEQIATNDETAELLGLEEIDELCAAINIGDLAIKPVSS